MIQTANAKKMTAPDKEYASCNEALLLGATSTADLVLAFSFPSMLVMAGFFVLVVLISEGVVRNCTVQYHTVQY